jgi:hypothetical protein
MGRQFKAQSWMLKGKPKDKIRNVFGSFIDRATISFLRVSSWLKKIRLTTFD